MQGQRSASSAGKGTRDQREGTRGEALPVVPVPVLRLLLVLLLLLLLRGLLLLVLLRRRLPLLLLLLRLGPVMTKCLKPLRHLATSSISRPNGAF